MLLILSCLFGAVALAVPPSGIPTPSLLLRSFDRKSPNVFETSLECPRAGLIYPCSCQHTYDKTARIHCHNVNVADLPRIFTHLSKFQISTMVLSDSSMDHMPGHVFLPMEINVLHLSKVNFTRLSFFYSGINPENPLLKLHNSLYAIEVEQAENIDQWDWSGLQGFKILDQVSIRSCSFPRLTKSFGSLPNTIERIIFEDVDMQTIAPGALTRLHNLKFLRINRTPLQRFNRNVLPQPANALQVLDLANNQLTSLPHDMFADMPNLDIISLRGNLLTTLSSSTFAQINFASHLKLYLSGNPFKCDCELRWLNTRYSQNRAVFGDDLDLFCTEPTHLRGERLHSLEPQDFQCEKTYQNLLGAIANETESTKNGTQKLAA